MKSRLRSFPRWVSRQPHLNFFRTTRSRRSRRNSNRGFSIVAMLLLAVTLTGMVTAYILLSNYKQIGIASSSDSTTGFYVAETGLNMRSRELIQTFRNRALPTGTSPNPPSACLGTGGSTGTGDFACINYTFNSSGNGNQRVAYTYLTDTTEYRNGSVVMKRIPPDEPFGGLNAQEYSYKLNSIANKIIGSRSQTEANLEMDLKSRIVPMFQFGAFYDGDLEMLPSPNMVFNGRVHTNSDLYLGGDNGLRLTQQVTVVGRRDAQGNLANPAGLFNRRKNNNNTYPNGRVVINNAAGTGVNLLQGGTGGTAPTTAPMNNALLQQNFQGTVVVPTSRLQMPYPTGTTGTQYLGTSSNFFTRADLRILYNTNSTATSPYSPAPETPRFSIEAVNNNVSPSTTTSLSRSLLLSMRLPVLAGSQISAGLDSLRGTWQTTMASSTAPTRVTTTTPPGYCRRDNNTNNPSGLALPAPLSGLSSADQQVAANALYTALLSLAPTQATPYDFANLDQPLSATANAALRTAFMGASSFSTSSTLDRALPSSFTITGNLSTPGSQFANVAALSPNRIVGLLTDQCFLSAPIQEVTFFNGRENRNINLLQLNLAALAVWNQDGRYVDFGTGNTVVSDNSGQGTSVVSGGVPPLFAVATADANALANTFQRLGYAASDISDGGLVIHTRVNLSATNATTTTSPYGIAITGANQLLGLGRSTTVADPTGVSLISDQAIYLQGDYNTVNKQPAAVLADSLNVLSNSCTNVSHRINKTVQAQNCATGTANATIAASNTSVNSAFLAGNDITTGGSYNGGLENYPRFQENWGGQTLNYRGSFVSLFTPDRVSGAWGTGGYYSPPQRLWDYDTDFNDASNLPPLDPRFVYLKQETFIRNFQE